MAVGVQVVNFDAMFDQKFDALELAIAGCVIKCSLTQSVKLFRVRAQAEQLLHQLESLFWFVVLDRKKQRALFVLLVHELRNVGVPFVFLLQQGLQIGLELDLVEDGPL